MTYQKSSVFQVIIKMKSIMKWVFSRKSTVTNVLTLDFHQLIQLESLKFFSQHYKSLSTLYQIKFIFHTPFSPLCDLRYVWHKDEHFQMRAGCAKRKAMNKQRFHPRKNISKCSHCIALSLGRHKHTERAREIRCALYMHHCWWLSDYIVWEKIESVKWFRSVVVCRCCFVLHCHHLYLFVHWSTYHINVGYVVYVLCVYCAHMLFIQNDFRKFRNIVPFAAKHKRENIFSGSLCMSFVFFFSFSLIIFFSAFEIQLHVKRQK